nr:phospholipase-like protein [Tanacetum cinerariifolium]
MHPEFGVENSIDYNKVKDPIPFRRRVFSSDLDGRPIRGNDVLLLIKSDVFKRLDDNDAVSLCCVGILQLVLLGVEDRRPVPNWILRFANDRVSWDNYPWGSYGQLPVERLVPDETEARSRCWVSSKAYFDGRSFEEEQIPRHLNQNNFFEVLSEMNREFEEQRRGYQQMKEKKADMYEKLTRFMEDMRRVPEANTTPIIADQHFGVSDISGFQSNQGVSSALIRWQTTTHSLIYQRHQICNRQISQIGCLHQIGKHLINRISVLQIPKPSIPSQPGTSNWQNPMTSRRQDAGILDPVQIIIRERTENANWTFAKSSTVCLHPENNHFMILTDPHNIGTLDGSVCPFPSWNDAT